MEYFKLYLKEWSDYLAFVKNMNSCLSHVINSLLAIPAYELSKLKKFGELQDFVMYGTSKWAEIILKDINFDEYLNNENIIEDLTEVGKLFSHFVCFQQKEHQAKFEDILIKKIVNKHEKMSLFSKQNNSFSTYVNQVKEWLSSEKLNLKKLMQNEFSKRVIVEIEKKIIVGDIGYFISECEKFADAKNIECLFIFVV